MNIAYLLLGSNLGNSIKYLSDASKLITQRLGAVTSASSLYQTASWGKNDQPDFINQVIAIGTELGPSDLLKGVLSIELALGRERKEKWGSRTIDIDILLYGDQIVNESDLKIPHPFLHERRFCLEPLCEIAPKLVHPSLNRPFVDLLNDLSDSLFVKKLS
ncbi:2-amino-4-hydroxy-6-hydroxymethyldihydropteridine diphosphokinase [Daejeonella lutea]|uniref:2-amino-4-hydroxy-6-hydroxymethyldihydropteridine pyrophosphokinase n=1 Tax=Daejeonella lutea TaxID=572036 RepID=A0A1T5AVC8_9SPHI|nr:2-amino-4-hydroxy-6-hydroxymethyldihydropteridine diphosphokinase [Daejeonella lutea]SKB38740.1 2-amino-4-hydroxy-6-hydroxymethyldihydropteridinediphosphokinase [Daejeonella lutea]